MDRDQHLPVGQKDASLVAHPVPEEVPEVSMSEDPFEVVRYDWKRAYRDATIYGVSHLEARGDNYFAPDNPRRDWGVAYEILLGYYAAEWREREDALVWGE